MKKTDGRLVSKKAVIRPNTCMHKKIKIKQMYEGSLVTEIKRKSICVKSEFMIAKGKSFFFKCSSDIQIDLAVMARFLLQLITNRK